MYKGLFLDLDGTARESIEGKFIQTPKGQRITAGVHEAIAFHKAQGYTIIGITNQGGCDLCKLILQNFLEEKLITQLSSLESQEWERSPTAERNR